MEKHVLLHDEVALKDRMSDPEDDMEAFNSPLGRLWRQADDEEISSMMGTFLTWFLGWKR